MNRERLEQLAYMLENHDEIFNKRTLLQKIKDYFTGARTRVLQFDIGEWHCGTAACALGSAACYPPFMAQGLKLYGATRLRGVICEAGGSGYAAGERFFGISYSMSRFFFDPSTYKLNSYSGRDVFLTTMKDLGVDGKYEFNICPLADYLSVGKVTAQDVAKRVRLVLKLA